MVGSISMDMNRILSKRNSTLSTMKLQYLVALCTVFSAASISVAAQSAQELLDSVLNPDLADATYSSYSSQIYYNATLYNQTPIASTNFDRLEASAKLLLPATAYNYAAGGAGLEKTVAANREAFDLVRLFLSPLWTKLTPLSGV